MFFRQINDSRVKREEYRKKGKCQNMTIQTKKNVENMRYVVIFAIPRIKKDKPKIFSLFISFGI
jgi:hypothetical protein